jgi:hypothetical protein
MQTFKRMVVSVLALATAGTFPFEHAEALPLARGVGDAAIGGRGEHAPYPFKCRYHCGYHRRPGYGWQGWSAPAVPHAKLATVPALPSAGPRPAACPSPPRRSVIFLDDAPHQPIIPEPPHPIGVDPASSVRVIPMGGSGSREGR